MTKTLDEVLAELDSFSGEFHRARIAVLLPLERVISHDDDEPKVRHPFLIAGYRQLYEMHKQNPRVRFTTIGAVIFPCTWPLHICAPLHTLTPDGDQPWILIKPEFMNASTIVSGFLEAAAEAREWWSTEGRASAWGVLEEEAMEEDARRTKTRKRLATLRRNAKKNGKRNTEWPSWVEAEAYKEDRDRSDAIRWREYDEEEKADRAEMALLLQQK